MGEGALPVQVSGEGQASVHQGTLSSPLPHWQTEQRRSNSGREQGRGWDAGRGLKVRRQRRNHSHIRLSMRLNKDGLQETTVLLLLLIEPALGWGHGRKKVLFYLQDKSSWLEKGTGQMLASQSSAHSPCCVSASSRTRQNTAVVTWSWGSLTQHRNTAPFQAQALSSPHIYPTAQRGVQRKLAVQGAEQHYW